MAKELHFLIFDLLDADDLSHTWQAMASVAPVRLPAVFQEVANLTAWAHAHLGSEPQPLDEGGDWDAWLQLQPDQADPCTLGLHQLPGPPSLVLPADTQWVTVTLTLVVTDRLADTLRLHLEASCAT
jgi:hypothetical protein